MTVVFELPEPIDPDDLVHAAWVGFGPVDFKNRGRGYLLNVAEDLHGERPEHLYRLTQEQARALLDDLVRFLGIVAH
jgi:hypothetical protein